MATSKPAGDPALIKLVERQMRNWELANAQKPSGGSAKRSEAADFICLSRSVGCPADEVAALLTDRLGWPKFDKEILDAMAGDDELRRRVYSTMDERDMGWMEEALRSLMQPEITRNDYFHRLTQTVLSLARQGHAVFLGRGVDLILPRMLGLRVRLVASPAWCVERYATASNSSAADAREAINRIEQERAMFIERHFKVDPHDLSRHDLVINMDRWTPQQAADLILQARAMQHRSR